MASVDPQKLRREVWARLPVFLEVAETGSIKLAAARLHLTTAAVSRTLRLLQEELGEQLFNRVGRRIVLNAAGEALRQRVRHASRVVEDGITALSADPYAGRLAVASLGVLTEHYVIPALIELRSEHPALRVEHRNIGTAEANAALLRGEIQLAFYYQALSVSDLQVHRIGTLGASIYCGVGHPLFRARKITAERVLEHSFSIPQIGDNGQAQDGWPQDIERKVGMKISLLRSNLAVALSGQLLTVLPDVTAAAHVASRELRRLNVIALEPIEVFAAHAQALSEAGAALLDRVVTRVAASP